MDFENLSTDEKLEIEGVWKDLDGAGARVLVARANNPAFRELMRKRLEPHQVALQRGLMEDDKATEILIGVMGETILLSWEGMKEKGVLLEPTLENRVYALRKFKPFREIVTQMADDAKSFREKSIAVMEGNFPRPSNGISETETVSSSS